MLTELRIENFAIIDRLELGFESGLIIFTGETGAGKSIIMDAVEMLLGGRAETTVIRTDADRANVEGVFKHRRRGQANPSARSSNVKTCSMIPTMSCSRAKSAAKDAASPASTGARSTWGCSRRSGIAWWTSTGRPSISPCSMSARTWACWTAMPMPMMSLAAYRQTYTSLQSIRRELNDLRNAQKDADRRIEMLTFQAEEIEAARLKPGEDEELKLERDRLANAEKLATLAQEALAVLDEGSRRMLPPPPTCLGRRIKPCRPSA